ncbi:MAG TPA: thiol-activated cytolysin family protein, partial [Flavobacterium sp.]|nr:thiol-activated cytolysin family protein [Flavobacterium sp.]
GLPGNVYSQEKPKVVQPKQTIKVKNQKPPKNTVQVGTQPKVIQQDPPVRVLNTKPVKLVKAPVLNATLFKNITPLKKVNLSDTRDSSDKTYLETTGSNVGNSINEKELSKERKENNCLVTPKSLDITTSDFSYFTKTSTPDFIKPGVVINYKSILDGSNTIQTEARNPMTVYLINTSAIPGLDNLSIDIEKPQNVSAINNALGSLTGKLNSKDVPANMSIELMEVNSDKELQYGVSGSYSYGGIASASFGISGNDFSQSYYYLINFTQNMYTVAADPNTVSFVNDVSGANNLAYVSEVTYGRKGLMMIKTNKSMSAIKADMKVSANTGVHKGNISGFINSVKKDSSTDIRILFYGGSSIDGARALQESNLKDGFDKWVEAQAGNALMALPISYKVKNLKGEHLKLGSVFTQNDRDCVPRKKLKLKVTLLEIDPKVTTDSDKKGDYGIRQHVKYTANKTVKKASGNVVYNTFKKETNPCKLAGDKDWSGAIPLACGSSKDQIHVNVNG